MRPISIYAAAMATARDTLTRAAHARDLVAARVRMEQLAAQVTQAPPPSLALSPNAQDALAILSTEELPPPIRIVCLGCSYCKPQPPW